MFLLQNPGSTFTLCKSWQEKVVAIATIRLWNEFTSIYRQKKLNDHTSYSSEAFYIVVVI